MNIKVSVIIPVYNLENYIARCLNSILAQDYPDIEIIVVNDGSTDGTVAVVSRIATENPQVCLVNQDNAGVSVARNTGIDKSTGELLAFVDGDDWLDVDFISSCVSKLVETGSSLVKCGFRFVNLENGMQRESHTVPECRVLAHREAIDAFLTGRMSMCVCGGVFLKSVIKANNISFKPGMKIGEDGRFMLEYLCKSNRLALLPQSGYNVMVRSGSASRTSLSVEEMIAAAISPDINPIFQVLCENNELGLHSERYEAYQLRSACTDLIKKSLGLGYRDFMHYYASVYRNKHLNRINTSVNRKYLYAKLKVVALICKNRFLCFACIRIMSLFGKSYLY